MTRALLACLLLVALVVRTGAAEEETKREPPRLITAPWARMHVSHGLGETDIAKSLVQIAAMMRHRSLLMVFSDLLADPDPVLNSLQRVRHGGHDVILFHVLDEAEVSFPFRGICNMRDPESNAELKVDADGFKSEYIKRINEFRDSLAAQCRNSGIDYVPVDTSMQFDKALIEYLHSRRARG